MKKILILYLMLLAFVVLKAQTSLFDCIDAALKNSYDIKITSQDVTKAKYSRQNGILSFLPSVSASKEMTRTIGDAKSNANEFSVSSPLSLFDSRFFEYKLSDLALKQSNMDYEEQKKNIVIDVIDKYLTLNLLKEESQYYENILDDYKKQLIFTKKLLKAGEKTTFDVYSIQIEMKNNEIELENIENEIKKTIGELNYLTGLSLKSINDLKDFQIDETQAISNGSINKTYSILSSELSLKNATINKYSALTKILPSIYLQGSLIYTQNNNEYNFIDAGWDKYWKVSLNFEYELGSLFKNYNDFRISGLNLYQQKLRLKKIKSLTKLDIDDKKNVIILKKRQILLDKKKLNFASQKFELAKKKYQSGLLDFFMLKDSANEILSAKIALISDKKDYFLNMANYQKALGKKILGKY